MKSFRVATGHLLAAVGQDAMAKSWLNKLFDKDALEHLLQYTLAAEPSRSNFVSTNVIQVLLLTTP